MKNFGTDICGNCERRQEDIPDGTAEQMVQKAPGNRLRGCLRICVMQPESVVGVNTADRDSDSDDNHVNQQTIEIDEAGNKTGRIVFYRDGGHLIADFNSGSFKSFK